MKLIEVAMKCNVDTRNSRFSVNGPEKVRLVSPVARPRMNLI